ncbi:hypothetical protein FD755_019502 [Muntiacus reevesi]|uniref:Hexosyltransferase n=1 Tax=Muntiacus reevesi TaxID=9886 RepID=A0A5N3XAR3_MUNRE|nr:hypothetical protein FD755_019502 [Muntiacus reevesi]
MMLKYMHDHYLDKYEWFMRADDDTGLGTTEEMGKLALEPGENFCMGGPGVIMSREVLRRMVPHIGKCLREMYTTHEDVEVGRCVRRFAGVQCVWSYEVRTRRKSVDFVISSGPVIGNYDNVSLMLNNWY